jgi:hypothetical protein
MGRKRVREREIERKIERKKLWYSTLRLKDEISVYYRVIQSQLAKPTLPSRFDPKVKYMYIAVCIILVLFVLFLL